MYVDDMGLVEALEWQQQLTEWIRSAQSALMRATWTQDHEDVSRRITELTEGTL